jgi:CheY-like chemotaxis protein/glycine cleavage system H lipoate-binding protein
MMDNSFDILIVDDEQVIIDSVIRLCSAEGWNVDSAKDARTGLQKIEDNQYRLIICDIMMPEMDGFQFLGKLSEGRIKCPVIITSGFSTVENAVKSLYSGAIDFLAKPFTVDELVSAAKRGLNYQRILQPSPNSRGQSRSDVPYVPCPAQYHRLGITTWGFPGRDGALKIGVTDMFLMVIGVPRGIQLFGVGEEIEQGNVCAHIVTEDQMTHSILAPFTGRIIDQNLQLTNNLHLLEKDPYFQGWIYNIIPSDLEYEMKNLTPCSSDRM